MYKNLFSFALVFFSASTSAFEIDGFSSGESKSAVEERVELRGWKLEALGESFDGMYNVQLGSETLSTITFCNNKLFAYSSDLRGGIYKFLQLTELYDQKYGRGHYKIRTGETTRGTQAGTLEMVWKNPNHNIETLYFNDSGYEQVTLRHSVADRCK